MLNAREPPPAVFWFLLHRCKRNSPAGEIPKYRSETWQSGRMGISAPTKGNGSKWSEAGAHCAPLRRNRNPYRRRPQAAPTGAEGNPTRQADRTRPKGLQPDGAVCYPMSTGKKQSPLPSVSKAGGRGGEIFVWSAGKNFEKRIAGAKKFL